MRSSMTRFFPQKPDPEIQMVALSSSADFTEIHRPDSLIINSEVGEIEVLTFDNSENNIDKIQQSPIKPDTRLAKWKGIGYTATIVDSFVEIADTLMSLDKGGFTNPLVLGFTAIGKFSYAMGLNGKAAEASIEEVFHLKTKGLPQNWLEESSQKQEMLDEWPALSPKEEKIARAVSVLPIGYNTVIKGVGAVFFLTSLLDEYPSLNAIPKPISYTFIAIGTTGTVFTFLLTAGTETLKIARQATHIKDYQATWDSYTYISFVVVPFSVFSALEEVAMSYMEVKHEFNLDHSLGLLALNSLIAPVEMCFSGLLLIEGTAELLRYLPTIPQEKNDVLVTKIVTFAISLGFAIYMAACMQPLTNSSYHEDAADFKVDNREITDPLFFVLSILSSIQEALLGTMCLYQFNPLHTFIPYLMRRLGLSSENMNNIMEADDDIEQQSFLSDEIIEEEEEKEEQDTTIAILAEGLRKALDDVNLQSTECIETLIEEQVKAAENSGSEEEIIEEVLPQPVNAPAPENSVSEGVINPLNRELTQCNHILFAVPPYNPDDDAEHTQTPKQLMEDNTYAKRFGLKGAFIEN